MLPLNYQKLLGMKVGFGQEEYLFDSEGEFTFTGNSGVPGLAIVMDENNSPCLMSLIPKPTENGEFTIDVHSTALSMVFLNPFICSSNSDDAEKIVTELEQLEEFIQFEELLQIKLTDNPLALPNEDEDLQIALNYTILAYINMVTADGSNFSLKKRSDKEDDIIIEPVSMVSGHNLEHTGENNFTIYNYYGRWAKCIIPDDDLYLPPNGDLVDVLKWSPLWEASKRSFGMEIIAGKDAKEVNVYGLGFALENSPPWEQLSTEEQNHVLYAGMMTVIIEFVPRIISVVTNTSATFGKGEIASTKAAKILGLVFGHVKIIEKARKYISDEDYTGFFWEMAKEHISLLVNDDEFQEKFITELGIVLTDSGIKTLACTVVIPLKVLFTADDLTGLAKSVLALYNAQLKTTFRVYSEDFKYGNVNGNVYDEETGLGIQGVNVQLLGDENNPMNPNYNYVTDASGGFWFENILTGKKTISVTKEEYGGKTVPIDVKDKETTQVEITLSKEKGTITGRVVNEIYIKKGITPINFNKECHLDIKEIGGNNQSYSFWIYEQENGTYSKSLSPGTYEIKASHEDYKEATVTVTITGNQMTQVEDLVLKPDNKMSGSLYYDINFDNSYEFSFGFVADLVGGDNLNEEYLSDYICPDNSDRSILGLIAKNNNELVQILIDTNQVKGNGFFNIGGFWNCGCVGSNGNTTVMIKSERFKCRIEEYDYEEGMQFSFSGNPENPPCDCSISNPGNMVLDKFGKNLGDVIKGSINVKLAGWKGCSCTCCDDDGDWIVDCAQMQANISFKVLVGTIEAEWLTQITE